MRRALWALLSFVLVTAASCVGFWLFGYEFPEIPENALPPFQWPSVLFGGAAAALAYFIYRR
jgi:hypothetical protein